MGVGGQEGHLSGFVYCARLIAKSARVLIYLEHNSSKGRVEGLKVVRQLYHHGPQLCLCITHHAVIQLGMS